MDVKILEGLITKAIPDADVRAVDLQGGDHFEVTVVSPAFEGCTLIQRHRMVYSALGDAMSGPIHAMTITALTPEQFREGMVSGIDRSE